MDGFRAELKELFNEFLGSSYDTEKFEQVAVLQEKLRDRHLELIRQFDSGELSRRDFAVQLNQHAMEGFKEIEGVLGREDFIRLFGDPVDEFHGFVNPETF